MDIELAVQLSADERAADELDPDADLAEEVRTARVGGPRVGVERRLRRRARELGRDRLGRGRAEGGRRARVPPAGSPGAGAGSGGSGDTPSRAASWPCAVPDETPVAPAHSRMRMRASRRRSLSAWLRPR